MKTVKTFLASVSLILLVSIQAFAGSGSKVIAVINHAKWCSVCEKNGDRAMACFKENNKDMAIQFVANDVTDDASKAKSAEELKTAGLDKVMANHKKTGVAYFFDAESKKLITQVSVAKSNEKLAEAMKLALNEVK
jgi:hypothetical protein